jgi:hypothetical protein
MQAMLLVGDSGYAATASLNQDFAAPANESDLPLSIQFDARVTDTTLTDCWSSICIGSTKNIVADNASAKFGIRPELDGSLQIWIDGVPQPVASRAGNNFRIVLSNTAGTGSAFNGNGSKATLYNGPTLVGTYTLPQLAAGDGYLSFSANPYIGSWNLTRIDNLRIEVVSDYEAWSTALGLSGGETGDDDHDGLSNFAEYTFGLDPKSGASCSSYSAFPAPDTGTFSYTRRKRSLTGMTFTVWTSTDLTDWTEDAGAVQATTGTSGDQEIVEVTLTPSLQENPRLFVRIQAN